jgi:hypothetical protein
VTHENWGLAHAATDAIPDMADVGLLSLERKLILLEKMLLVDSVIDEIPRKVFVECLGPVDEEIRVDLTVHERF